MGLGITAPTAFAKNTISVKLANTMGQINSLAAFFYVLTFPITIQSHNYASVTACGVSEGKSNAECI